MRAKLPLEDGEGQQSPGLAPFQYSPLGAPTHIRVLDILPGNANSEIHFRLREKRLGDGDIYHAISYAWGPPVFTHRIYSVEGFIQVTENLWEALNRYRERTGAIPANCPDAGIYSGSKRVLIWLGLESPSDRSAFDFITRTVDYVHEKGLNITEAMIDELWAMEIDGDQVAVTDLFSKSWFRRVWTFQEIVCAVETTFTSGSLEIEFTYLLAFWWILTVTGQWVWLRTKAAQRTLNQMSFLQLTKLNLSRPSAENSLFELVKRTRTRLATDPRDMIYGLVALASDTHPLPFAPTYKVAVNHLYEEFAAHVIRQNGSLDIFGCCVFQPGLREWPSWVPDWRYYEGLMVYFNPEKDSFNAAGQSRWDTSTPIVNHSLGVEAICLDRLQNLTASENSPELLGLTHWERDMLPRVKWQLNIIRETVEMTSLSRLYRSEEERWHAWWRTFIGEKKNHSERATSDYERLVRSWKELIDGMINGDLGTKRTNFSGDFAHIQLCVQSMQSYRKFCLTLEGRIGWVPRAAQKDDIVSLMRGSPVPVIIRPSQQEDSYLMIGQCYIHGIIDGEAVVGKEDQFQRIQLV